MNLFVGRSGSIPSHVLTSLSLLLSLLPLLHDESSCCPYLMSSLGYTAECVTLALLPLPLAQVVPDEVFTIVVGSGGSKGIHGVTATPVNEILKRPEIMQKTGSSPGGVPGGGTGYAWPVLVGLPSFRTRFGTQLSRLPRQCLPRE